MASNRQQSGSSSSSGGGDDKGTQQRQPWDAGRALRTALYFNPPPSPQQVVRSVIEAPIKVFKTLTKPLTATMQAASAAEQPAALIPLIGPTQGTSATTNDATTDPRGVVLVTGATGGVGARAVGLLLQRGRHVRALVRDVEKGRKLLGQLPAAPGARLDLAPADVAQSATCLPEAAAGVKQVIWASAATVVPKEGDTPDRAKYRQGIKFYDPTIQGDTPEAVEYRGMLNVLAWLGQRLPREGGVAIFDPRLTVGEAPAQQWGPVDDVVMGGASASGFEVRPGAGEGGAAAGVFSGFVTTANNGGFASVRTRNLEPCMDLSAYDGLELRVYGDGKRYKCIVRTEAYWDGVGYTASFDTRAGEWQTVRIPWNAFVPVFRAKTMPDAPPIDAGKVTSIQLMLSKFEYDGRLNPTFKQGAFELPVQRVGAYLAEPVAPRFVMVSSAGVTRPNRPGIKVEEEPPAVRMNDALGGLLTYKLAGEDALRAHGVPFAIVRPVALTEEPAGAPLEIDQGDVIRGKVSRDDVAQLCVALLDEAVAADTTFEIKSTIPFSEPWEGQPGAGPRDWRSVLSEAGLMKGVTGKTVNGVYTGKQPEKEAAAMPSR
jgi:uncharacterized protein YbjT (DUF2867 family)